MYIQYRKAGALPACGLARLLRIDASTCSPADTGSAHQVSIIIIIRSASSSSGQYHHHQVSMIIIRSASSSSGQHHHHHQVSIIIIRSVSSSSSGQHHHHHQDGLLAAWRSQCVTVILECFVDRFSRFDESVWFIRQCLPAHLRLPRCRPEPQPQLPLQR